MLLGGQLVLLAVTGTAAKHVAVFGVRREAEIDVYAAVSDGIALAYDDGGLLAAVGCEISDKFEDVVVHPDAKFERTASGNAFIVSPAKGSGIPTGWVATVKLPTDKAKGMHLEYGASTFVEPVGGARVTLAKEEAPWIVLFSGEPTEKKTVKSLWVFGPDNKHIRSFGLGFAYPLKGLVTAASSYTTRSLEVVSAFTATQKIAWGVFSPPFLTPMATPVGTLTFEKGFVFDDIDATSKDTIVELEDYQPAPKVLIVHAPVDLLKGSSAGKSSGGKASEWKVDI